MFYHLKIILRSLRRNFTYSAINIAGLAIGITASVLIFLWVYNERSYDKFRRDADRIYRINYTAKVGDNDSWVWASTPYPLAVACKNIPGIEGVAVMNQSEDVQGIRVNNELFSVAKNAVYVDKSWLEMLDYKIIDGSLTAFGNNPFSVALTESEAKKYFGNAHVVGQTVRIKNNDYMIQAVMKDNPSNSTIRKNVFVSIDALLKDSVELADSKEWGQCNWITFVKLSPGVDVEQISKKINDLVPPDDEVKVQTSLRRLTDIHFETDINNSLFIHGNSKTVSIFTLLGLLLLFTACINYVNLTTAKANLRAKEVGMRKIIGAKRKTLFLQFITESFLVSLVSILISLLLLWILAPLYHLLVEDASFSFSSPVLWAILGIVLLTTT
ncbi:MAG: ABC transporter permease, partial [Candidatus Azobacteroides sp.]|nr:ABC transporter permease [Candidatus Azobacteroides sp.]